MKKVRIQIGSPSTNSDILYGIKFYCIDPVVIIETEDEKIVGVPSTEFENFKKKGSYTKAYNISEELKDKKYYSYILLSFLQERSFKFDDITILVPEIFPVKEADFLVKSGIRLEIMEGAFYPERVSKSPKEIDFIRENSKKNSLVMREVYNILGESKIDNNKNLIYNGEVLTSEYLQNYILKRFLDMEMIAESVIVAIGSQGCFPHEYGSGPIKAYTSIIVDIFPRSRKNYYYSDMTRTFCKGKAPDDLKYIYNVVYDAQRMAMDKIHSGEDGNNIHQFIKTYFENKGFKTGIQNGILQGFFHGTGHGLGLDCHEYPYIGNRSCILPENSVVSVEPGLYYLDKGCVRIEDIVVVTKNGCENLIDFEKRLEIE